MEVLVVRKAILDDKAISLEEFCWDSQALRNKTDLLKLITAGLSFIILDFQIIIIRWMGTQSQQLYFVLGGFGLVTNAIEAASQPRWLANFQKAFSGVPTCAPSKSTLMSAVGILLAAEYPAAQEVAKMLYPDNVRFQRTRDNISQMFKECLCTNSLALFKDVVVDDMSCHGKRGEELASSCSAALL